MRVAGKKLKEEQIKAKENSPSSEKYAHMQSTSHFAINAMECCQEEEEGDEKKIFCSKATDEKI